METIINRKKIELTFKNKPISIENLLINEMEVEIECGASLIDKTIILIFLGEENKSFKWPFYLSEGKIKRMSNINLDEHPWLVRELTIESNGCENYSLYLTIYKNNAEFF